MDVSPRRNIMDDLLKEAIADAKAVRETALENAKIALEEAFTPRLQSMLSKKIQSEIEAEGAHEDDEDVDERMHDEDEDDMDEKMRLKADDEDPTDDASEGAHEDDEDVEERMHGEEEDDDVEERMHDEDEDEKKDEAMHDEDEDDMEEDLDLEAVLKELENEAMHDEDEDDEKEESVDENDVSSGIGKGDNAHDKKSGDSTDIGKAGKAKFESKEQVEEDIDLDEVLKALTEEDEVEEEVNEVAKLQSELQEHRDVVKYLRGKLNEVNLLNAKLLFTNKLFRAYGLSNDQKMKVVETFDRATNLREVKLVYSTLAESFGTKTKTEIKESKGSASKAVASTKSEKQEEILTEGAELRDRFKKLAGIKI